jgi:hypothetical protein
MSSKKEQQLKSEYEDSMIELYYKYNYDYKLHESRLHLQNFQNLTSSAKCKGNPFNYYPLVTDNNILCSIESFDYIPKHDDVELEAMSKLNFASFYLREFTRNGVDLNEEGKQFRDIINYNIKKRVKKRGVWGVLPNSNELPEDYANTDNYHMCFLIYKPKKYEILIAALVNLRLLLKQELTITYCINIIVPPPNQEIYAYMDLQDIFEQKIWKFKEAYEIYNEKANKFTINKTTKTTKITKMRNKYLKYKNKYLKLKNILLKNE